MPKPKKIRRLRQQVQVQGENPKVLKALTGIRESIVRIYGEESLAPIYAGEEVASLLVGKVKNWMPTGVPKLDAVLGRDGQGLPCGKLLEIFGMESHGKSSLAYFLLGATQRLGGIAILLDTELSYDPEWAKMMGVDPDKLIVILPNDESCVESFFDMIEDIVLKARKIMPEGFITVVMDTIYCTLTKEELDSKSYTDKHRIGALSRALSTNLKALCRFISNNDVLLIFLNQVRDNIGVMYGDKLKTPGGHALLHMCSVRVAVKRMQKFPDGSIQTMIANVKNKVGVAFKRARVRISPKVGLAGVEKGESEPETEEVESE